MSSVPQDPLERAEAVAEARGRAAELAERRLADARADARSLAQQNEKLNATLREARESLLALREQLAALSNPPEAHGLVVGLPREGLADVSVGGRTLRVAIAPELPAASLQVGSSVLLNEAMMLVELGPSPAQLDVVVVRDVLADGTLLVGGGGEDEHLLTAGPAVTDVQPGQSVAADRRAGVALAVVERSDVTDLLLDEMPDVDYADIGGLGEQIEQIRDAVELPFLHRDLFARYQLPAPKGVLLYGPPGCGKTMIAKAVANSLAEKVGGAAGSHFLNIKGPELLNKYVGETERHIRLVFQRAREKASEGTPVIVFFDEMDSVFRTRGSGVSSDVENTIVPQLLSEIDGVEGLENVIVIGASNREDMIDPAILRPGRLDVKIKIERPDAEAAKDIFSKYILTNLPLSADDIAEHGGSKEACVHAMINAVVLRMYSETEENRFLEVTYANGDKEVLYFKDFNSGAMIQNIVDRGKKMAIKEFLSSGKKGLRLQHLLDACLDEFRENEDLPNTTNPDDWARISGKKGERIVYIRTLVSGGKGTESGRSIDTVTNTGQYL